MMGILTTKLATRPLEATLALVLPGHKHRLETLLSEPRAMAVLGIVIVWATSAMELIAGATVGAAWAQSAIEP